MKTYNLNIDKFKEKFTKVAGKLVSNSGTEGESSTEDEDEEEITPGI